MHYLIKKIEAIKEKYRILPLEVKASFWFLICAFFQRGISVISTPIFTRLMSTAEYGEFSVFYSWYGIVSIFMTLNLFYGVYVRGLVTQAEDMNRFTSSMQGLMLTLATIWLVIYCVFRNFFNDVLNLNTFQMISMIIIIWTNGVFNFWAAEQRVKLEYRRLVIVSILTAILMPIVQVILILNIDNSVNARISGMVIISVIFYPILFAKHMIVGRVFCYRSIWKYALKFNIPLIPHYLSQIILNSADRIMINQIIGVKEAGIYSLAYSISQISTVFNIALMQTLEPWLYKKIKNAEISQIKQVAYPAFIIVAVVNIMLIALAPEIVSLFAPKEYKEAIWIIPPVAMSVFFMFTYTFFAVFEFYYEKANYITIATMVGAIVNIVLNYIFIKKYGYYAAGYITLLCYILYSIFHYVFMRKLVNKNHPTEKVYDLKILLGIIVLFMSIGFLLLFTYDKIIMRYGILLLIVIVLVVKHKKILSFCSGFLKE